MDINNTLVKLMKNDDQDSESGQSDFIPAKSTDKVIKSFIKCVSALVLHVENVLSNSNGHFISSQINSNNDNDVDIVEHAIKEDPDDASRYLRSIKKCMLQLCLLCVEQNIYVNYDLKFYKIDYYSCLDDSTRSLVINYLTENVVYMIEHIGFIISMFKQEKYLQEAKDIRKSLQKIYKQILLIPLNSNLDETPKVCQNLNSSQWHLESMQSLGEKLSQLRTALIKFKKVFKKKILEQDYSTENSSIYNIFSPGKRKISNISDEPPTKRLKQERNEGTSPDQEFLVPQVPPVQKNHLENEINDVRVKKNSEKQKKKHENNENDVVSDTESVKKKKKHKINSENSDSETIIILENDTEHFKKKKKHKSKLENSDNESMFSESNSEIIEKKNKHKSKSENTENNLVLSVNNSENVRNKPETKSGNYENESAILISDTEKKTKRRSKSKNRENNSDINEHDSENIKNKSKTQSESDGNDLIIIENGPKGIKKKKMRRSKLENEENNSVVKQNTSENVKNKSKTQQESDVNDLIIIENESDGIKKKKKRKSKLENVKNNKNKSSTESENDLIILENDSEGIAKKHKRKSKSKNRENDSLVDKSISENVKNKSKTDPENCENDLIILENDSESIKKRSKSENKENDSIVNKSISENVKNKSKIEQENDVNDLIIENKSEGIKKKKSRKSKSEIRENYSSKSISEIDSIILESDSENITKKNKHRSKSENMENNSVVNKNISKNVENKSKTQAENCKNDSIILESDSENITKKSKHRSKSENRENNSVAIKRIFENKSRTEAKNGENDSIILESDSENITKKSKHRSKSENRVNNSVVNESIFENVENKSETEPENGENDSIVLESSSENIKKKNKHKSKSENRENNSIVNKNISENVKNKSKTEPKNGGNDSIILESDSANITEKNQHKFKSENKENDSIVGENDSKNIKKKKSHESKCVKNENNSKITQSNHKNTRNKNESESNKISAGEAFNDNDNSVEHNKEHSHKVLKTKNKSKKLSYENDSDDIFGAIYRGEMETAEVGHSDDFFQLIAKEKNLTEEERFLYIQELLLEAKENNELSPKMKEELKNLNVLIDWEVPPIHKVEKRLTAGPTPEEKVILNSLGVSNKQYNLDEDDTIRKNWEDFCKLHNLEADPKPFLMFKHGKESFLKYEDRKKFVQFLGKGLPHRALNSIYRRFKRLFRDKNKLGRFSPQEDELILTYCNKTKDDKHKFADLANILNRNRPTIEARYRTLTRLYRDRVNWNKKLEEELINGFLKAIKSNNVEDLRTTKLTGDHYKKVANELKIFWEKVRAHWLKSTCTKLFSSIPLHVGKIRLKTVQILIDSKVTDWKKIDWQDVESHFEGVTKEFLMVQLCGVQVMAPERFRTDLGAVLKYSKEYLDTVNDKESAFGKMTLKRYKMLKDGSIEPYV